VQDLFAYFLRLKNGFESNISIRIHIEGSHYVGLVFNFNFQSSKQRREREDAGIREGPMPDCT
jgi:hypothetical protein